MSAYNIAWLIIGGCALLGGGLMYYLMRNLRRPIIRVLLIALTVTFFLVPASVPNYPEQLAPAFVIFTFETFFQIDGAPQASFRILLLALSLVGLLILLGYYLLQRYYPEISSRSAKVADSKTPVD